MSSADLHISCAAEGEYVAHSAAMIHSVLEHADGRRLCVHYLHGPRFASRAAELLTGMVETGGGSISFLEVPDREVAGLPVLPQFTQAMWYRIFLPELLPGVDRVLYLDADTIAVDSLSPLWEVPLGDSYLAAVTNVFQPNHFHRPAQLGLPGPKVYFNSGVLLMNLDQMRARRLHRGAARVRAAARSRGDRVARSGRAERRARRAAPASSTRAGTA